MENDERCLNCGSRMYGPMCSECGQKKAQPIEFRRIFHDLFGQFVELDFRFARTLIDVIASPGMLANHYLAGKRIHYTNPIKFLFLSATFYFLVITFLDIKISANQQQQQVAIAVAVFMNYLIFIFLLPTAWIFLKLFRARKLNYAESFTVLCFLWSGYLILASLLALIMQFFDGWFVEARIVLGIVFLTFALKQFSREKTGWVIAKTLGLYAAYFVSTSMVVALIIAIGFMFNVPELQSFRP